MKLSLDSLTHPSQEYILYENVIVKEVKGRIMKELILGNDFEKIFV